MTEQKKDTIVELHEALGEIVGDVEAFIDAYTEQVPYIEAHTLQVEAKDAANAQLLEQHGVLPTKEYQDEIFKGAIAACEREQVTWWGSSQTFYEALVEYRTKPLEEHDVDGIPDYRRPDELAELPEVPSELVEALKRVDKLTTERSQLFWRAYLVEALQRGWILPRRGYLPHKLTDKARKKHPEVVALLSARAAAVTESIFFPTGGMTQIMNDYLTINTAGVKTKEVVERKGVTHLMQTSFGMPDNARLLHEDVYKTLTERLLQTTLRQKEHGAALLKTHLDLSDKAHQRGGTNLPLFEYDLRDALDRLGYKRPGGRRGFDDETMREHYRRILVLTCQRIDVWEQKQGKNKKRIVARAPYWLIQEERLEDPDDILDIFQPVLIADPKALPIRNLLMQPGTWWLRVNMSQYYPLPVEVLQLPTDGNGNEVNRRALVIATWLATWARTNQKQHAGKRIPLKVRTLLEGAGIIDAAEFSKLRGEQKKRHRAYLEDHDGKEGALPTLRSIGAFDIEVADEAAFYASGRGWVKKFLEARLMVTIPNLNITRLGKSGKRKK